jgi:hypothetical protein
MTTALPEMDREELAEAFAFLDELRAGGSINMFGATPVLQERLLLVRQDAEAILKAWMATWDGERPPEERAASVT